MYGDQLRYLPLEALIIMLHLLMTQLEKYGYISLDINLMYFKLLRTGNAWLKMRLVRNKNVSDLIMVVSIAIMNLKIIAPLMAFVDIKLFQGLHRKMEWLNA